MLFQAVLDTHHAKYREQPVSPTRSIEEPNSIHAPSLEPPSQYPACDTLRAMRCRQHVLLWSKDVEVVEIVLE